MARALPQKSAPSIAPQPRTYALRITPTRAPGVFRTVELSGRDTLHKVHLLIQQHFALDDDHLYAFFLSGQAWDEATEYSPEAVPRRDSRRVTLDALALSKGQRFLYIFDFGDELSHEIMVEGVGNVDTAQTYPRLLLAQGEPPPQYDEEIDDDDDDDEEHVCHSCGRSEMAEEIAALAPEIARAADAYEERVITLEEPSGTAAAEEDELRADLALARRLIAALARQVSPEEQFLALCEEDDADSEGWLMEMPFELAHGGMVDEAQRLCQELATVLWPQDFLAIRALILSGANRTEEALAQCEEVLQRFPREPAAVDRVCEALLQCRELDRAEALTREMMAWADPEDYLLHAGAMERLVSILRQQGRDTEAREEEARLDEYYLAHEDEFDDDFEDEEEDEDEEDDIVIEAEAAPRAWPDRIGEPLTAGHLPPLQPYVRPEGKVGRNEPCTCGSGKKYKKCCGA